MTSAHQTVPARRWLTALAAATVTALVVAGCGAATTDATSPAPPDPTVAVPVEAAGTDPAGTAPDASADGAATTGAYPSAITDQTVANPAFDALGRDITRRTTAAGLPGASLLVLHDGELVEQEAFGDYTLDTVVPIASASKWLSGATIMTLVDDGLLDLDAPLSTYLPDVDGAPGTITTRQLLSFTSGLEYDERIGCMTDRSITLADCNAQILDLPLLGRPGTGYRYTGTHLHVAAGVAEAVTGQPFEQLFQERIAGPLGMAHTTFVHPGATAADGHPNPAGGATSTLGDYGRFLEMLGHDGLAPDGTRILDPETIAEMGRDQTGDARFVSAAANRKADETPYGLAHWLDVTAPDGTGLVESSPGKFGFRPWIDHVNGIAGVYLVVDRDDTHVADSPDRPAGTDADVQTSGTFVVTGAVRALDGRLPAGDAG